MNRTAVHKTEQAPQQNPAREQRADRLWSVEEASWWLGVPVNTLYGWRTRGYGPRAVRIGRHLRYLPDEVRGWVQEQIA